MGLMDLLEQERHLVGSSSPEPINTGKLQNWPLAVAFPKEVDTVHSKCEAGLGANLIVSVKKLLR